MTDFINISQIIELERIFLPHTNSEHPTISKAQWKSRAVNNFHVIIGMMIAGNNTAEQIGELVKAFRKDL
jgi:hypothetical protein